MQGMYLGRIFHLSAEGRGISGESSCCQQGAMSNCYKNNSNLRWGLIFLYVVTTVLASLPKWIEAVPSSASPASNQLSESNNSQSSPSFGFPGNHEQVIRQYLKQLNDTPSLQDFHIQGWRWHTLSLIREAERFSDMAQRFQNKPVQEREPLIQATNYVIGFNLKGLHKIEADLFFPWMKKKLMAIGVDNNDGNDGSTHNKNLSKAFEHVMNQLETDRKLVAKLGESIVSFISLLNIFFVYLDHLKIPSDCNTFCQSRFQTQNVQVACNPEISESSRSIALKSVIQDSKALVKKAQSMMDRENALLVPAIAASVPESEQKSFNTKVLSKLGLWDSRLHLCGMHEAVWSSNNKEERKLFEKAIPSIPQMMIPRWKTSLYEPESTNLDL
jgi:hypothetical protein